MRADGKQPPQQGEAAPINWTWGWVIMAHPEGPRRRIIIFREQESVFQSSVYVVFFLKARQVFYPLGKLCNLSLLLAPLLHKSVIIREAVKDFSPVLN